MKKKVTYTKDAFLHIRVDSVDKKVWEAMARKWNVTLTKFVIACMNAASRKSQTATR